MKAAIRICLVALLAAVASAPAGAQDTANDASIASITPAVRSEVLDRYRVAIIRHGIVLTPRRGETRAIEVTGDGIAIDGQPVSGGEVRERLGADAALILQLSYASADELRQSFGSRPPSPPLTPAPATGGPPASQPPPVPSSPEAPPRVNPPSSDTDEDASWERRQSRRRQSSGAKVRFAGSVTVREDEHVRDAVVAIGGSVSVRGHVDGDVVAIGGGVHLGPQAVVRGSVTSIGGGIRRDDGSQVYGEVVELGVGGPWVFAPVGVWAGFDRDMFSGWFRLMGTGLRISLLLLVTLVVVAVADRPVSRIADRIGEDPWLSGFVGLLAEILFVPVLVVTVVFLAISIIGIPLLLLVPFALVALFLGILMGFAGVARRLGRWAVGRHRSTILATTVGVVLIVAAAIVARLMWLVPGPVWPIAAGVSAVALFLEYVAWTVGLGGLLLTRFGTQPRPPDSAQWAPPPVPPPVPSPVAELQ